MMVAADAWQRGAGVRGDLLEVGAYLGRSSVLLGLLRREGESLHVCDVFDAPAPEAFEDERETWYPEVALDRFLQGYRRFVDADPTVHVGPSEERLPGLPDQSFRIVHIDGSHTFEAVRSDIAQAARLVTRRGIVVFDDIASPHTPGVPAAVQHLSLIHI